MLEHQFKKTSNARLILDSKDQNLRVPEHARSFERSFKCNTFTYIAYISVKINSNPKIRVVLNLSEFHIPKNVINVLLSQLSAEILSIKERKLAEKPVLSKDTLLPPKEFSAKLETL